MNEKDMDGGIRGGAGAEGAAESAYEQYKGFGGIINEKDYQSALERAKNTSEFNEYLIAQTETIARAAGIKLYNSKDSLDPRTKLYGILRHDENSTAEHHHSQMSDQRLFAEVLRMLGDTESLEKLIKTHPHISF
jgi:hypothetical protein